MALAFLLRFSAVLAIPKASSAAHAEDNAKAGDLQLTDEDIARIDKAFPKGKPGRGLPMI